MLIIEFVKLPDLIYILVNIGEVLIQKENHMEGHSVRIRRGNLSKEAVSTAPQVLGHCQEWFKYYVGFNSDVIYHMLHIPSPKVLID